MQLTRELHAPEIFDRHCCNKAGCGPVWRSALDANGLALAIGPYVNAIGGDQWPAVENIDGALEAEAFSFEKLERADTFVVAAPDGGTPLIWKKVDVNRVFRHQVENELIVRYS